MARLIRTAKRVAALLSGRLRTPATGGLLRIAGGSSIAQIVGLAAAPLLSRMYAPEQWGVFAVVSAFAVIFGTAAGLRLELAIPLPSSESEAYNLLRAALATTMLTTLAGASLVFVAKEPLAQLLGFTQPSVILVAAPIIGGLIAAGTAYVQLALRIGLYSLVATRNVVYAVGASISQLILGLITSSSLGLILGLAFGYIASVVSLVFGLRHLAARSLSRSNAAVFNLMREHRRHSLLLTPAGLLNALGTWLPPILMSAFGGVQAAGLFALAQRVLVLPVSLFGGAISQVYLSELARSERLRNGEARRLFYRASRILTVVSVAIFVPAFFLLPMAFDYIFGPDWSVSGEMAQALCLGVAAQLIGAPLSQTLIVLHAHVFQLSWDGARLVGTVAIFSYGGAVGADAVSLAWWFSAWSALMYGISWFAAARAIAVSGRG